MRRHRYSDHDDLHDPVTGQLDQAEVKRRAKGWIAVALALAVLLGGGLFVGLKVRDAWVAYRTHDDFPGPGQGEVTVVIPPNTTVSGIGKILQDANVVKSASTFKEVATARQDDANHLQAGKYKLTMQIPAATALSQLLDPTRAIRVMLQLREGLRLSQQLEAIAKGTGVSLDALKQYVTTTKPQDMGLPAWAPANPSASAVEGFLFPDTYQVPDGPKADTMVKKAIAQFNAVAKKLDLENTARNGEAKDPYQALIVASIIEREVFRPEDRPKVARVIYNRLAIGMPLQLDSTVAYSVGKTDTIWTTDADRGPGNKSPYNTYQVKGLPPGPISAPAEAALEAALKPDDGDWLYFSPVDLDSGETMFTASKAEHDANVAQLKAWCNASDANRKKCA